MQSAETVLGVLRERGRRGLPLDELYRQLFNPELYFLAYGDIYVCSSSTLSNSSTPEKGFQVPVPPAVFVPQAAPPESG